MSGIVSWGHTRDGCRLPAHSAEEWNRIILACGFRCFYCAEILAEDKTTKDHLVPLIRRGCACRGNLVASCLRCNSMKKKLTVYEFLRMKPALVETTGEFYTTVISLGALCDPDNDPLLREIRRISEYKAFPAMPSCREPERSTWAWRNPA